MMWILATRPSLGLTRRVDFGVRVLSYSCDEPNDTRNRSQLFPPDPLGAAHVSASELIPMSSEQLVPRTV